MVDLSGSSSVSYRISLDLNEIFPELLTYPTGSLWNSTRSFRIFYRIYPTGTLWTLRRSFWILPGLSGSYPISPVLAESLLISPDLCGPYLIFGSQISPESFRILLDISGFLQIFQVPLMTEHGVKRA
jgi:hypothetical protein